MINRIKKFDPQTLSVEKNKSYLDSLLVGCVLGPLYWPTSLLNVIKQSLFFFVNGLIMTLFGVFVWAFFQILMFVMGLAGRMTEDGSLQDDTETAEEQS